MRMNDILSGLRRLSVENAWFILLLFVLNISTGAVYTCLLETPLYIFVKLPLALLSVFFISFLIGSIRSFFRSGLLRKVWTGFWLLLSGVLFTIEFFSLYNFDTIINATTVQIFLESNTREASEFLEMYVSIGMIAVFFGVVVVLCGLYWGRNIWMPLWNKLMDKQWAICLLMVVLLTGCASFGYGEYRVYAQNVISYRIMTPLQRLIYSYCFVQKDFQAYQELKNAVGRKEPVLLSDSSKIENIVLVIGESLGRNHMQLYGYKYPTNPLLTKLFEGGELYRFNNTVSPSTGTIDVISRALTFYNYEQPGDWYEYDILMDIMKKAGYKTFWLSNQESFGSSGNLPAALAERCDFSAFCSIRNSQQETSGDLDEHLLPILDSIGNQLSKKNFIVVHLLGSHVRYVNRYPVSFDRFKADDVDLPYNSYKRMLVAQYDNAALYNDYILNEIINRFKDKDALLLYISDHAEEVYDYRDYTGRSYEKLSGYMVEVPFLIWTSELFRKNFPDKTERIASSVDRPYMTDDLIHTILDLSDIRAVGFDSLRSVVNPAFNLERKRMFQEKDYDLLPVKGRLLKGGR